MNKAICSKCKKRPAVIFVSKIEEGKATQEGYCMKCALDMNIGPIKQMMANMGITEDEVDAVSEQFTEMFDGLEGFQPGGAGTIMTDSPIALFLPAICLRRAKSFNQTTVARISPNHATARTTAGRGHMPTIPARASRAGAAESARAGPCKRCLSC